MAKEWSLPCLCMGLCLVSGKNFGFAVVDFSQGFGFGFTQSIGALVAVKLTRSTRKKTQHKIYAIIITTN